MATKTSPPKDPQLQEHTRLVRAVESNLKVTTQDEMELRFRSSLIRKTITDLPKINPSLVTRLYEAVCDVDFPAPDLIELRQKLQAAIAIHLNLREHRAPKA